MGPSRASDSVSLRESLTVRGAVAAARMPNHCADCVGTHLDLLCIQLIFLPVLPSSAYFMYHIWKACMEAIVPLYCSAAELGKV